MPVQDELRLSDASVKEQTRTKSPTNTATTPDSAINLSDEIGTESRKRKRDGSTMEDLLRDSFAVRPYPPKGSAKPRTLQPLLLLPRSKLPLSYLDICSTSSTALPKSRLFESHVKILEFEERMGDQPMVLIARLEDDKTFHVVEREDRGLYVICKLGSWVNILQLRTVAAAIMRQDAPQADKGFALGLPQSTVPTLPTTSEPSKFSQKKRLAIEAIQSMVKRPSTGLLPDSQSNTLVEELEESQIPATSQGPQESKLPLVENTAPLTSAELFENIRTQYLDALYLSNTSLAYFAKGPLSRARAAFHLDYESNLEMSELIAFLESLVLSANALDKKYRDGLPECVSMMDIEDHSANEAANSKPKRKRISKKMKPGKNGLYPMENEKIRKWWEAHDEEAETGAPGVTREDVARTRISNLRIRETQLQIILILEILALRPLATVVEDLGADLPGIASKNDTSSKSTAKVTKPDQLIVLIDVHVDRLCIWQSIASDLGKEVVGDSQVSTGAPKHSDNIPRDFCVDIIAPFFSYRLPERCTAINKKLGGPVTAAPPKKKLARSASASGVLSKPGAATKRSVPSKSRERLARVLTNERREQERRSASAGPNRKIALMRSATMPAIPGLKRENSEAPSLSSIMSAESQPILAARGGVLNSKRFSQREVNFSSLVPDTSAKAQKQAKIDSELKEAIAALKKPNRELAGKSIAETAEQRAAPVPHPRKSKKPVRNPFFQGVQISATPRVNRQIDMFAKSQVPGLPRNEHADFAPVPSSSAARIPQSSLPSQSRRSQNNPFLSSIQATPTRKTLSVAKTYRNDGSPMGATFPPSSPIHVRRSSAQLFPAIPESVVKAVVKPIEFSSLQETPVKMRFESHFQQNHLSKFASGDNVEASEDPFRLQETPVKKRPDPPLQHTQQLSPAGSDKENSGNRRDAQSIAKAVIGVQNNQQDSIYKSLGWDDDDVDELP